jgi:pyruvate/2-oxoglutarate dehydrogenase complex dihydrolipoamide acyltransferase (E2) component
MVPVDGTEAPTEEPEQKAPPVATANAVKLAEEKGIDLSEVEGTGVNGTIVKKDVEAAVAS